MIELPTERSTADIYNPKLLLLYGKSKAGKSTIIANLEDNLVIDLEDGYRALSVLKVQARSANDLFAIRNAILEKARELKKYPYKSITIDNATRLEELALPYAADLYRNTAMGAKWGYKTDPKGIVIRDPVTGQPIRDPKADVRTLPNGSGYVYLRNALDELVDMFQPLCETLILVGHIKTSQINKNGEELSEMNIDLTGKSGALLCGKADAIGYVYRKGNKTYVSFEGGDDINKGARPKHLANKKFLVIESDEQGNLTINTDQIFKVN